MSAAETVEETLDWSAQRQQQRRKYASDQHQLPLTRSADDADAGGEPDAGRAGEAVNPFVGLAVNDDACTKEADPGQDTLNDAAGGVGNSGPDNPRIGEQNRDGR